MATVNLSFCFLAPASDLSDTLKLAAQTFDEDVRRGGSVRLYVGGRRRLVVTPNTPQKVSVLVPHSTSATVDEVRGLLGTLCLLRDTRGRALYGSPMSLQVSERRYGRADIGFTFLTTTDSAAV